ATADNPYLTKHFANRVLSSTRISEAEHDDNVQKTVHQRRRRLRLLDEDEDEEHDPQDFENIDPSLASFPLLPSSIPIPEISDDETEESSEDEEKEPGSSDSSRSEFVESGEEEYFAPPKYGDKKRSGERHPDIRRGSPTPSNVRGRAEPEVSQGDAPRDEDVDEDVLNRLRRLAKGAAKKTVQHPRPKLDPQILLSDKGLPALLEDFKKVRFRGKGFEFQDLDRLLFVYEAWANRLLSKSSFPEIIERLEKVGTRREIQVALHRLRNGIWPPYMSVEQVEDEEDSDLPMKEPGPPSEVEDEEAAWERALRTMPAASELMPVTTPSPSLLNYGSPFTEEPPDTFSGQSSATPAVSEEDRAERNRRLALERLAARTSSQGGQLSQTKATP
ncbi:replication Fork Protection Component Swi3, partial [Opisthorchis viverrini]